MTEPRPHTRRIVRLRGNTVEVFGRCFRLPANRLARMGVGAGFIVGGVFSFLPVLGLWMLPVGLLILSVDLPFVRRWRRRTEVRWGRRRRYRTLLPTAGVAPGEPTREGWFKRLRFMRR